MEGVNQSSGKGKKSLGELTSLRKIEVSYNFSGPSAKGILMQTIKQLNETSPINVIVDLLKDINQMESFRSDSGILGALKPLVAHLGTRIQSEFNSLTVQDLVLVQQVLIESNADQTQIDALNTAIQNQFEQNLSQINISDFGTYFTTVTDTPSNAVVRHFIQKLRLDQSNPTQWYESSYKAVENLQGELVDELKVELEIGFKYQ